MRRRRFRCEADPRRPGRRSQVRRAGWGHDLAPERPRDPVLTDLLERLLAVPAPVVLAGRRGSSCSSRTPCSSASSCPVRRWRSSAGSRPASGTCRSGRCSPSWSSRRSSATASGFEVGRRLGPWLMATRLLRAPRRPARRRPGACSPAAAAAAVVLGRWVAFFRAVMPALAGIDRHALPHLPRVQRARRDRSGAASSSWVATSRAPRTRRSPTPLGTGGAVLVGLVVGRRVRGLAGAPSARDADQRPLRA